MIPPCKPYLSGRELIAALRPGPRAVPRFEAAFAAAFETRHALAFRYGRSGLWALFKALGIEGAEVILPAYTCAVVGHAIVLSGNEPRFVDVSLHDYNMDLAQVAAAISERTRAIIATHVFGYPLDVDRLREIVRLGEARWGHKIWVFHDCAHAFGARWRGEMVCNTGDVAFFSLHLSKVVTSHFGGMVTTADDDVARKLRAFRDEHFVRPRPFQVMLRYLSFLEAHVRHQETAYGLRQWLKRAAPELTRLRPKYHLADRIGFPPDHLDLMTAMEAGIGLVQLAKYAEMVRQRQECAADYDRRLRGLPGVILPPLVDGATYSHYVVRVEDASLLPGLNRQRDVHFVPWCHYSLPETPAYRCYAGSEEFPNAARCATMTVPLPVHPGLGAQGRARVAEALRAGLGRGQK